MRVIVDAFGGDHAPLEILKGCEMAARELEVEITLTGNEDIIEKVAKDNHISLEKMEIVHAGDVMTMEDDPTEIRTRKDSSMAVGLNLLAEGRGDAFVSAGNTGAILTGATLFVKRIKGVTRAAIGTVMPAMPSGCYMLMDAGANAECRSEMLAQFAAMGSLYMEKIHHVHNPRVGLVNIGSEPTKGTQLQLEAYQLLSGMPLHFIGNMEGRDIPGGCCDVAVCDGFVGNVLLKVTEGVAKSFAEELKRMFLKSAKTKVGYLMIKGGVDELRRKMDYTEYGGAPLMGISKPVIKAHGSSNAKAIKNAIRQAKLYSETGVIDDIRAALEAEKARQKAAQAEGEESHA